MPRQLPRPNMNIWTASSSTPDKMIVAPQTSIPTPWPVPHRHKKTTPHSRPSRGRQRQLIFPGLPNCLKAPCGTQGLAHVCSQPARQFALVTRKHAPRRRKFQCKRSKYVFRWAQSQGRQVPGVVGGHEFLIEPLASDKVITAMLMAMPPLSEQPWEAIEHVRLPRIAAMVIAHVFQHSIVNRWPAMVHAQYLTCARVGSVQNVRGPGRPMPHRRAQDSIRSVLWLPCRCLRRWRQKSCYQSLGAMLRHTE